MHTTYSYFVSENKCEAKVKDINKVVNKLTNKVDKLLNTNKEINNYEIYKNINNNFSFNVNKAKQNLNDDIFVNISIDFNNFRDEVNNKIINERIRKKKLSELFIIRERMGERILKNLDITTIENALNYNNTIYKKMLSDINNNIEVPKETTIDINQIIKTTVKFDESESKNEYNFN
ncbi:hypothetical protein [Macrococcoides bohemicum]|uniref:hypothetical protein n=1 Tax=Macrococcoides bohemicum TaxID=1903056 RepID=UPI00165D607E|nr:hypothetical protein [Macrococcus bohemicus]MBC9873314.1 hypothetical protein [Macrococcus bohemicus]